MNARLSLASVLVAVTLTLSLTGCFVAMPPVPPENADSKAVADYVIATHEAAKLLDPIGRGNIYRYQAAGVAYEHFLKSLPDMSRVFHENAKQ